MAKRTKGRPKSSTFSEFCFHPPRTQGPTRGAAAETPERLGGSAVFFLKLSDAPRSIDDFLLTCIKRVAVRTDLYMEILSKS